MIDATGSHIPSVDRAVELVLRGLSTLYLRVGGSAISI